MTVHRCAGGLKKKLDLRSGSQRHRHFVGFFNVPVLAPTRDHPFFYGDSDTPPQLVAFYDRLGIRRTHSRLNPRALTGVVNSIRFKWCIHLSRSLFLYSPTWCHRWWTSESPRAHVAKFYGRLRLIRSVWEHQHFPCWNCNCVGFTLLHHLFLASACFGISK